MTNEELILKHGFYSILNQRISFTKDSLDALLAEHLAVNSSQPIYQVAVIGTWMDTNLQNYIKATGLKRIVYTANPINKELLDAVKSLRDGLKAVIVRSNIIDDMPIANACHEAIASLSPNVTKLLESE